MTRRTSKTKGMSKKAQDAAARPPATRFPDDDLGQVAGGTRATPSVGGNLRRNMQARLTSDPEEGGELA